MLSFSVRCIEYIYILVGGSVCGWGRESNRGIHPLFDVSIMIFLWGLSGSLSAEVVLLMEYVHSSFFVELK